MNKLIEKKKWVSRGDNVTLDFEEFYVSYNPCVRPSIFDMFMDSAFKEETALYSRNDGLWMILNGDFRKEYEKISYKGLDACIEFYKDHKEEFGSDMSTDQFEANKIIDL